MHDLEGEGNDVGNGTSVSVSDRVRRFNNGRVGVCSGGDGAAKSNNLVQLKARQYKRQVDGELSADLSRNCFGGALHTQIDECTSADEQEKVANMQQRTSDGKQSLQHSTATSSSFIAISHEDSNDILTSHNTLLSSELSYYRVTFKGVVALLANIDTGQHTINHDITAIPSPHKSLISETGVYLGYGEIVATSSPILKIPIDTVAGYQCSEKKFIRAIRVDVILTGGYSQCGVDLEGGIATPTHQNRSSRDESQNQGYLLLEDSSGSAVAESISQYKAHSLGPSFERGPFVYSVRASSPVKVLSGPYLDAPSMRCALLPDTTHEVSLRVSVPIFDPTTTDGNDLVDTLVDDGDAGEIQFLRLSKRRGWVADRRVDTVDGDAKKLRVSYLMKDVTNDEGTDFSFAVLSSDRNAFTSLSVSYEDTSSLNTSTISHSRTNASFYSSVVASSVVTPPAVKAQRKRHNTRRRKAMEESLQPTIPASLHQNHRSGVGESFETESTITGAGGNTIASGGDESFSAEQVGKTVPYYLMRVIAPSGLKILDAPHFQVSHVESLATVFVLLMVK